MTCFDKIGKQYACPNMYVMYLFIHVATFIVTIGVEAKVPTPTSVPSKSTHKSDKRMKDLKVLPDVDVIGFGTDEPEYNFGEEPVIPVWPKATKAPMWWNSKVNSHDFDDFAPKFDIPTMKPAYIDNTDFNNNNNNHHFWDEDNQMNSYSWITLVIVLVVFFKVIVIGVIIARRMRSLQHQAVITSAESTMTLPGEFTSDQAHLVTPANITYVNTDGAMPPQIPPLYTESLLPIDETCTCNDNDQLPPYSR